MEGLSIKNETSITIGLVIVIFAAAFSVGGIYMKVNDTAERLKAFEEKQNQMALDIAAIKQAVGVNTTAAVSVDHDIQLTAVLTSE